ncbi:MAG: type II toxin-antitoxin system death-on-curing family toxin [Pirellulales bacterium]|nr:type II toxin-antitoxin system death-on-curing family toxin [Pirellulales bacterium]
MRYLTLEDILEIHGKIILRTGGSSGIRDLGALKSAVAQPRMIFDGIDLYRSLEEKASALGFSLICNHPFLDGNQRIGHAAIETFLVLNGHELEASVEEAEVVILRAATGEYSRSDLVNWIKRHLVKR